MIQGKKHKFHLVPSGILNQEVSCVVGNGVVVHVRGLMSELDSLKAANIDYTDRLKISDRAHIVFDFHQKIDAINEARLAGKKIGTTHKGIGPAYGSKTMRNGIRMGDLREMDYFESRLRSLVLQLQKAYPELVVDVDEELEYFKSIRSEILPLICDTIEYCHDNLSKGRSILIEGANAMSKYIELHIFFITFLIVRSDRFGLWNLSIRNIL